MKLIDFDGLFDEKLAQYMTENKDKHSEREWENVIPKLYKKFGDTRIAKIGCTPKEYYAKMTDSELVDTLKAHLQGEVPVSEFLCAEIEGRNATEALLPLLEVEDAETASYAINLVGDAPQAFERYFAILTENRLTEDIRSDVTDILRVHADEVKQTALAFYGQDLAKEYMLEILSRVKAREEEIFQLLLGEFRVAEETSKLAGYLAAYGDERALPHLLARIEDRGIGFVEFQELKYAIEALGGEYDEPRDFSRDKDYIAVEAASFKAHDENKLS